MGVESTIPPASHSSDVPALPVLPPRRLTYQRHEVPTYWVVDDEAQLVEVWHPRTNVIIWAGSPPSAAGIP